VKNMGKRIYVKPKLTVLELAPSAILSASLGISNDTTDTSGRAREYDDFDCEGSNHESNHNHLWDQTW
jgi:hypothetical protein